MDYRRARRGSSMIAVELLGNNIRFLTCVISAATIVSDENVFCKTIIVHF